MIFLGSINQAFEIMLTVVLVSTHLAAECTQGVGGALEHAHLQHLAIVVQFQQDLALSLLAVVCIECQQVSGHHGVLHTTSGMLLLISPHLLNE